jgi:V/A-type H+-transporting ATPase subunit B
MTLPAPIEYASVSTIRGPLLIVQGVGDVGWDEVAEIRLADGETRHGVVLEVHDDLAVVEVFEGTQALKLADLHVSFSGSPFRIPVGEAWLGRVCNGRGAPLDGGPPVISDTRRYVSGSPVNPAARDTPSETIVTGVSAIDGLATLVRGQKLPIFSVGGLPHLELAAQVASQAHAGGEPFAFVFAAVGMTQADAMAVRETLEARAAAGDLTLLLNTADDPLVERVVTPRIALTIAEHLAFDLGRHVLVLIADVTSYAEAVRELSAARGEVPSRRGFPGYLYSDLASLYERAGRIKGRAGSVTQVPVLTMPGGDITHPVPDLTGYITEGQLVLSPDVHVYPPFDPLASLSRLMRLGADRDHIAIASQVYALVARARQIADLADVVGEAGLTGRDRRYLAVAAAFPAELLAQLPDEARTLEDTLARSWRVASTLPKQELTMVSAELIEAHYANAAAPE